MMKQMVSIREFRGGLSSKLEGKAPILVTNHGEPKAMVYPLGKKAEIPMEVRKDVFRILAERIAEKTAHIDEEEMQEHFEAWRAERRRRRR